MSHARAPRLDAHWFVLAALAATLTGACAPGNEAGPGSGVGGSGGASSAGTGGSGSGTGGAGTGGNGTGGNGAGGNGAGGSGGNGTGGSGTGGSGAGGARDAGAGGSAAGGTGGVRDAGAGGSAAGGAGGVRDAGTGGSGAGGARDAGAGGAGGAPVDNTVARATFPTCRFHFGTIDSRARTAGATLIAQLDYITPGWMLGAAFDQMSVCNTVNTGVLAGKIPVVVAYVAAGNVKRDHRLCDCNVAGCAGGDLCQYGAQYIRQDWAKILTAYRSYSQGYANCYGTSKPIIFEMEPDWYQYTGTSQTQPWTAAQAGQYMTELVNALKTNLPNARFSLDVSPWVGPSNGMDNGAQWYSNFDMSLFTFVNTSGGGTNANTAAIRSSNRMTWAGLHNVTRKPILADTGYGANGMSAGHDAAWDVAANVNARIADGVTAIAQYNPNAGWATAITNMRGQLTVPPYCQ